MVKKEAKERNLCFENSCGVTSFNLGIVGLLLATMIPAFGIILGFMGVVFGYRQLGEHRNKWASWGIGISLASLALGIFFYILIKLNPGVLN